MSTYLNISDKIKLNSGLSPLLLNFYEGSAAAYSLRKLDALYNGDAITVRRASDSNTQNIGFVNNELDTASLESFVNSGQTFDNPEITSATGWTIGANTTYNASTEAFDLVNENGLTVRQSKSVAGHTYAITIVLNNVISGGVKVYAGGTQSAVYSTDGTHTFNITAGSSNNILGINPNGLVNLSISSFYAVDITGDGFVTTWYDQSGNSINATNASASSQPKIVSSGSTILENGKPAISFVGIAAYLSTSGYIFEFSQNEVSAHIVKSATDNTSADQYMFSEQDATPYSSQFIIGDTANGNGIIWFNATTIGTMTSGQGLIGIEKNSSGLVSAYMNGSLSASATPTINVEQGNTTAFGTRADLSTSFYNGLLQEVITYKTDNSANRSGIETNINNFYSIY